MWSIFSEAIAKINLAIKQEILHEKPNLSEVTVNCLLDSSLFEDSLHELQKSLPQVEVDPIWYFDITGGIPPLVLVNDNACLTPRSIENYYNEVELVGL